VSHDPGLYFAEDGAPRSERFGDIYYSLQDGLSESRAVFLEGCGLPAAWRGRRGFTVLELGFGTGLNIAAVLKLWNETRASDAHLTLFSVEGFLMTRDEAARALSAWPELAPFAEALLAQWPKARRGFARFDFPQWGASLILALMDVREALAQWDGQADALFLDGFSPALNPDMWAEDVMQALADHAAPGARLATFTVAGAVRRGLQAAGFAVRKMPGFGRKRERLEAEFPGQAQDVRPPRRIAIIGAGIAGSCLSWQARAQGLEADVFSTGEGASGNPAALVTPRLDAGNPAVSALFADAFAYATDFYRRVCPDAIVSEGVDHAGVPPRDAARFAKILAQDVFAHDDLTPFSPDEAPDLPGLSGLRLHAALCMRPVLITQTLLAGQTVTAQTVTGWRRDGETLTLRTEAGDHSGYDAIVLACGAGLFDLGQGEDMRAVRGQVEYARGSKPQRAASWGGYAAPLEDGFVFGATHDRDDRNAEARDDDRLRNIATLARAMPEQAAQINPAALTSRAAIRVASRDHLPRVHQIEAGVWRLTGLGGRGFCLAPLLAADLIASLRGASSPLPRVAKTLLSGRDTKSPS
jgi:tRNA 5-methylaminomethyl-2-thiouridine biosynthesis bifunctional protein